MTRINKYLASLGVASRRKVDAMIEAGKVRVNGQLAKLGQKVDPRRDKVTLNGQVISAKKELTYIILNKPKGVISTAKDTHDRKTVVDLVRSKERLFPVGRLDSQSEGLILLTNDGELMQRMTHPKYHVPKVYEVVVLGNVSDLKIGRMRSGMRLRGGDFTSEAKVEVTLRDEHKTILMVTLGEGKNRQIRRMCEALHLHLLALKRVSMGPVKLGDLGKGQSRMLESKELKELEELYRAAK
ncbi:rRNA pseudouridine synthase [Candidatus Curtissbacteria bacterium]|nr:rRNA pseudouridine synthase [Candidatus Curtissbacteria bacterium]